MRSPALFSALVEAAISQGSFPCLRLPSLMLLIKWSDLSDSICLLLYHRRGALPLPLFSLMHEATSVWLRCYLKPRHLLPPMMPNASIAFVDTRNTFFLLSQSTSWRLLDCSTISAYPLQPRLSSRCSALPYFSDLYTADLATVILCCWCSLLHLLLLLLVWSDLLLICYYYCSYWYSLNFWVFIEFITGCDIGCYKYFVLFCSSILSIWW